VRSQSQGRPVLAWSLWLTAFGCCAGGLACALALTRPLTLGVLAEGAVFALTFVLGFATVGLVMTLRLPANPIGWLYAAAGLTSAWDLPFGPWIEWLVREHRPVPLAVQFVAVVEEFSWAPAITLGVTLPALLLPNGRLRSRRWRVVVATSVAGSVLTVVAGSLLPGQVDNGPTAGRIDNPFGLAGPAGTVAGVLVIVGVLLHWASLPAAGVCVLLRFRASRGVERQQMRWVAAGAAGAVVGLLLSAVGGLELLSSDLANTVVSNVIVVALLCPPIAIAVAVLRYRLWDLDRLVSRTVTYTLVTGLVVVPFLLVLPVATRLVGRSGSLAVAVATLAAAAVFQPLRRRVQDRVDRRFNRRRYDAAQTIRAFSGRLRQQIDLDHLTGELVTVVDQTMQPTQVAVWLRASSGPAAPATRSPRP
jgi:hypothetical protein